MWGTIRQKAIVRIWMHADHSNSTIKWLIQWPNHRLKRYNSALCWSLITQENVTGSVRNLVMYIQKHYGNGKQSLHNSTSLHKLADVFMNTEWDLWKNINKISSVERTKSYYKKATSYGPFKSNQSLTLPFLGHMQTVQTHIRCHGTWRLIRVLTVCSRNFYKKYDKNEKSTPDTPQMKNGLFQLIRMGKAIRQIWVNLTRHSSWSQWTRLSSSSWAAVTFQTGLSHRTNWALWARHTR